MKSIDVRTGATSSGTCFHEFLWAPSWCSTKTTKIVVLSIWKVSVDLVHWQAYHLGPKKWDQCALSFDTGCSIQFTFEMKIWLKEETLLLVYCLKIANLNHRWIINYKSNPHKAVPIRIRLSLYCVYIYMCHVLFTMDGILCIYIVVSLTVVIGMNLQKSKYYANCLLPDLTCIMRISWSTQVKTV